MFETCIIRQAGILCVAVSVACKIIIPVNLSKLETIGNLNKNKKEQSI